MTALTVKEARANFTSLLRRAEAGEDIGITYEGQVFAFQPIDATLWFKSEKKAAIKAKKSSSRSRKRKS